MERAIFLSRETVLLQSRSYQWAKKIKVYLDDYYLDGIIGLIPIVGSVVGHVFNAVYVYIALTKLRSKRLALVMMLNGLKDLALGLIPVVGVVLDFFYQSNKKNFEIIEQFAANDPATIRKVNQQVMLTAVGVVGLMVLSFYLIVWSWRLLMWLLA